LSKPSLFTSFQKKNAKKATPNGVTFAAGKEHLCKSASAKASSSTCPFPEGGVILFWG